jgi:hypothetical protein
VIYIDAVNISVHIYIYSLNNEYKVSNPHIFHFIYSHSINPDLVTKTMDMELVKNNNVINIWLHKIHKNHNQPKQPSN